MGPSLPVERPQPTAGVSRTRFHKILHELELIETSRTDDEAFVDDILLQLELWAADIREAEGSLE